VAWVLFELLRGTVGRTRDAGAMSSATLSIGLEPADYVPQGLDFPFSLTNAVSRGQGTRFIYSQSGSLSNTRTGSRNAVVADGGVVAGPRTLQFPISALLTRSCAFAHAAQDPTFFRHK
jgi:hypothetical protein